MPAAAREPSENTRPFPGKPGSVHLGAYRLERKLGQGGMGIVFEATHLLMNRRAAVKILRPLHGENPAVVERFRREIALLGRMPDHPNLVRAQFAGEENGLLYLVMDFVEGIDLNQLVGRLGPLPVGTACALVRQAAQGLEAIHRAGLVHRDLKPSNLILTSDGAVKILDLGLARLTTGEDFEELTPTDCHLGTLDYQAPEQASDARQVDIRADIYSLGCTLYKLLSGRAPFADAPGFLEKMRRHAAGAFPALDEATPGGVSSVLSRMVAVEPERRYATPGELVEAFGSLGEESDLPRCYHAALAAAPAAPPAPAVHPHEAPTLTHAALTTVAPGTERSGPRRGLAARFAWPRFAFLGLAGLAVLFAAALAVHRLRPLPKDGAAVRKEPGENAAESPEPAPASRRPFLLDGLPELQWHDLLESPPREILLQKAEGRALARFDPKLKQFVVTSPRNAVFLFGEIDRPSYTYQVGLMQIGWSSGAGIVLGYRPDANADDRQHDQPASRVGSGGKEFFPARFQYLVMHTRPDEKGTLRCYLTRGFARIEEKGDRVRVVPTAVATQEVSEPLGEQVVEVAVQRNRMREVRVNGVPLALLAAPDVNREFQAEDYRGGIGTFNTANSCTYLKANLKILPTRD